jgi:2-methylcitrate dehydratase PrpD
MALRDGGVSPASYARKDWLQADIQEVMGRMRLIIDPDWDVRLRGEGLLGGEIEARDRDGRAYRSEVRQFRGHPDNPLSDGELVAKLEAFVGRRDVLGEGAGGRLFELCGDLAEEPNLARLVESWTLQKRSGRGD